MEKVEVLISAMDQTNMDIFNETKVNTDALLINQSDVCKIEIEDRIFGRIKSITTKERGLSNSRNMAISNSTGDICLICDDDEQLANNYKKIIIDAFKKYPDSDIICFKLNGTEKTYSDKSYKIGYIKALKVCSCQMAIKRMSILNNNISFDNNYGSGTYMGSGEENIFIYDCLKKGLTIRYVPELIGTVRQEESKWFKGFNDEYFLKRGSIIRRLMGKFGYVYCLYFAFSKIRLYKNTVSLFTAIRGMIFGMRIHVTPLNVKEWSNKFETKK